MKEMKKTTTFMAISLWISICSSSVNPSSSSWFSVTTYASTVSEGSSETGASSDTGAVSSGVVSSGVVSMSSKGSLEVIVPSALIVKVKSGFPSSSSSSVSTVIELVSMSRVNTRLLLTSFLLALRSLILFTVLLMAEPTLAR